MIVEGVERLVEAGEIGGDLIERRLFLGKLEQGGGIAARYARTRIDFTRHVKRLSSRTGAFLSSLVPGPEKFWDWRFHVNRLNPLLDGPLEARAGCNIRGEGVQPREAPIFAEELGFAGRSFGGCNSAALNACERRRDAMATKKSEQAAALKLPPLWDRLQGADRLVRRQGQGEPAHYKASKIAIIVCAIIIPIVAEFSAMAVIVAAGIILLLESLQQLNKWQENWILYRSTCEGLRNEQHLYNEKAGPYAKLTPDEAHRVLAERVGALASAEHSRWVTAHREKVDDHAGE